ncbi:MAG: heme-binding domain-containing protein [Myxococcota bacterium]
MSRSWTGSASRARRAALLALALGLAAFPGCERQAPSPPRAADLPATPAAARYRTDIYPILETRCLDCHHAEVEPPWYARLPLVGEWVRRDVEWGRQRLDLSVPDVFLASGDGFGPSGVGQLHGLRTALLDDTMPPRLYRLTHPTAALSSAERATILEWVDLVLAEEERPGEDAEPGSRALHVFRSRCARCHREGVHEDMNGAFDFVTDLEFLAEDEDYVVADEPDESPLFERLVDEVDPMPPSPNDSLSEEEIEWVRAWIADGAAPP